LDYLIVTNDCDPIQTSVGYFPAESFDVISDVVPSNWEERATASTVQVMPHSWLESGFFERFYDGDRSAISIFKQDMAVILKSDP
jgi:hypothetical protein